MPKGYSSPVPKLRQKYIERFHSRVSKGDPNECWLWQGQLTSECYGVFWTGTSKVVASRIAYFLHYGVNPGRFRVCHTCDIPPCCNPLHLFLGTNYDNAQDRHAKKRDACGEFLSYALKARNVRGESHPNAKVTAEIVKQIRQEANKGTAQNIIARKYSLSRAQVCRIVQRIRWIHI